MQVAGVLLLVALTLTCQSDAWQYSCPYSGVEVCGSNGVTYKSKCAFNLAQSLNSSLSILHEGPCKPKDKKRRPKKSQEELDDLCKSCQIIEKRINELQETLKPSRDSEDNEDSDSSSPVNCPYSSDSTKQICGSDGVTYKTKCAFLLAQSLNDDLSILHEGPCKPKGKKKKGHKKRVKKQKKKPNDPCQSCLNVEKWIVEVVELLKPNNDVDDEEELVLEPIKKKNKKGKKKKETKKKKKNIQVGVTNNNTKNIGRETFFIPIRV